MLREVGGDIPTYLPAGDVQAWEVALRARLEENYDEARVRSGVVRAAAYRWEQTACDTWEVLRTVCNT
ncbi:hypothetical protein HYV72_00050 [Candidatus Uhrbacteria bacterium]|nr:hypothetical protein [Candidatus Uhrbacteria bacterium]